MSAKIIPCKTCGKEIASTAKACPHCGARCKKPFFKKWWFWLIVVLLLLFIGASGGSEDTLATDSPAAVANELPAAENTANEPKAGESTVTDETEITPVPNEEPSEDEKSNWTLGQVNALASAESYLSFMPFSYEGLIDQLEYEGFTHDQAVYGVEQNGY